MSILFNMLKKKKSNVVSKLQRIDTVKNDSSALDDIYLIIDEKNSLNETNEDYIENIVKTFQGYKESESSISEKTNKIMNKFFEKFVTQFEDIFTLSQSISKLISKNKKIEKDLVEEQLSLLVRKSRNNKYKSNILNLNLEICKPIAIILSYTYSKMGQYKIKNMEKLFTISKSIISKKVDIWNDFCKYCDSNKKNKDSEKLTKFCKDNKNKYDIQPEIIFIINKYSEVKTINIDVNAFTNLLDIFNIKKNECHLTDDDLLYFEITVLNIYWLFNSLNNVRLNFIDEDLETILYYRYKSIIEEDIFDKNKNQSLKMNNLIIKDNLFSYKWNFKDKFIINEYQNSTNKISSVTTHKSIDLSNNLAKLSGSKTVANPKRNKFMNLASLIIKPAQVSENSNPNRLEIVRSNVNRLEFMIMSLYSLNNFDNEKSLNLELISNDSLNFEFLLAFKKIYNMDWISKNFDEFHFFDLILCNNLMKNINKLNIEINGLDPFTFVKLLNFLYFNRSMTEFNLSLFSAEITYFTPFIYKIFERIYNIKLLKQNYEECTYLFNDVKDIEEKMLNHLSKNFIYNMQFLFHAIKKKKNLTELGFNFDIPLNIVNKEKYMNTIFKFILNILYHVSNSRIRKFCLLSPYTLIDCRKNPEINNLINNIDFNNNTSLEELSLQMQFYQIVNINIIIIPKLKILNIGDLDIVTFKLLSENICTDEFNKNSCLEKLTIGLFNTIREFNIEIKLIFEKLFRLKIKNFTSLNIFTNIEITTKYQYLYLLGILNNNWIPEYKLTFNKNIFSILEDNEIKDKLKKIYFLVPHNMEQKLLEDKDIMEIKKFDKKNYLIKNINKDLDIYDESYWCLKYLFEHVYTDDLKNDERTKKMIFDILKYIYFIKNPKIIHKINDE